jgi:hypothetical protein
LANTLTPPAIPINSETQPMPLISGSSHSSKNTRGRRSSRSLRRRAVFNLARSSSRRRSARSVAPMSDPTVRIIARMPSTLRWLKA